MGLADDLQALRDRTLADLNAAHDYFTDTKSAWRIVRRVVKSGYAFTIEHRATGTVTAHSEVRGKSIRYVESLTQATFQQFLSIFESFLFDLLRLWLLAYPQSLGGRKVDFKEVLAAPDRDAIASLVIDKELSELFYDRPAAWFEYLEGKVNLGCPTADEIARLAEAKASRDVLSHNRGVANKVYISKAGPLARFKDGERIEIPEDYHRATWELLRKVVADVSNAAIAKAGP
jgi:hypothetical protein